jgi:hypothetical protein
MRVETLPSGAGPRWLVKLYYLAMALCACGLKRQGAIWRFTNRRHIRIYSAGSEFLALIWLKHWDQKAKEIETGCDFVMNRIV